MTQGLDQLESRQLLSSGFQVVASPTITAGSTLNAVSAVSPTDVWAVGDQGSGPTTLAENFNGTSWSAVATPNPAGATFAALNGVSGLSSNAVWAIGNSSSGPLVEFFNGTSWSVQTTPTISGGGGTLNAVTAISPTDVWAVGNTGTGEERGQPKPASSDSGVVLNGAIVPPTVATTTAAVMGTVESPSSTPGTNKNGLTS